jgi:hypothetical protein
VSDDTAPMPELDEELMAAEPAPLAALADLPHVSPSTTIESAAQNALIDRVNQLSRGVDDAWINPTFQNGWGSGVGGVAPIRFRKLPGGLVVIQGYANGGTTGVMFNLPAGYRPSSGTITLPCIRNNGGTVTIGDATIGSDGNLQLVSATSWVAITGCFHAA